MLRAGKGVLAHPSGAPDPTPVIKGFLGFQAFVLFCSRFVFSLFQIFLVSLDYARLISNMGILHLKSRAKMADDFNMNLKCPRQSMLNLAMIVCCEKRKIYSVFVARSSSSRNRNVV